jgi:hypothetical protein
MGTSITFLDGNQRVTARRMRKNEILLSLGVALSIFGYLLIIP